MIDSVNDADCCATFYARWEDRVTRTALEHVGYPVVRVTTGDGDSVGPLTRVILAMKDGVRYDL